MAEEKKSGSKAADKAGKTEAEAAKSPKGEDAKPAPKADAQAPATTGPKTPKASSSKKPAGAEKPAGRKDAKAPDATAAKSAPAKADKSPAKEEAAKTDKKAPAPSEEPKAEAEDGEDVTIVEEGEEAPKPKHTPRIKPELGDARRAALAKRRTEDRRRPAFRRQQWFEFRKLERSGWRKPTGQDSAMRRHFGYRPPVVRVGYRGPTAARGLHPSGFEEVRVENVADLERIDPKTQAARVSGTVGRRKLKVIYETAEKRNIRILNRRAI